MVQEQDKRGGVLAGRPVIIDESPMVFWDGDDSRAQVDFLESIDPTYFRYLAEIHEAQLEGENSLSAAVALRATYSHALESLFAFIGAAVQSPHCPAGWLLRYKNADLKNLVSKISNREPIYNKSNLERAGWREVANSLLRWGTTENDGTERREASTRLWKALARDVLDKALEDEYNSLKHGLRVQAGEWFFAVGLEDVPGTPAPPERMRQMSSSHYGSSFLRALSMSPLRKNYWGLEQQRVNWNPTVFARRIPLIADSLHNVVTFLKVINGVPIEGLELAPIYHVAVSEALTDPDPSYTVTKFAFRRRIDPAITPSLSKENILDLYLQTDEPSHEPQETEQSKSDSL